MKAENNFSVNICQKLNYFISFSIPVATAVGAGKFWYGFTAEYGRIFKVLRLSGKRGCGSTHFGGPLFHWLVMVSTWQNRADLSLRLSWQHLSYHARPGRLKFKIKILMLQIFFFYLKTMLSNDKKIPLKLNWVICEFIKIWVKSQIKFH